MGLLSILSAGAYDKHKARMKRKDDLARSVADAEDAAEKLKNKAKILSAHADAAVSAAKTENTRKLITYSAVGILAVLIGGILWIRWNQ